MEPHKIARTTYDNLDKLIPSLDDIGRRLCYTNECPQPTHFGCMALVEHIDGYFYICGVDIEDFDASKVNTLLYNFIKRRTSLDAFVEALRCRTHTLWPDVWRDYVKWTWQYSGQRGWYELRKQGAPGRRQLYTRLWDDLMQVPYICVSMLATILTRLAVLLRRY